jgi:hypothetical protein
VAPLRWLSGSRGQSAVELALLLPILLLILLGIAEGGQILSAALIVEHAAREGARLGITGADDAMIVDCVCSAASTLDQGRLAVDVSPAGERDRGTMLTVTVNYSYLVVAPLISQLVGGEVPLSATLSMRVE